MTGIALATTDARAAHADLKARDVDVDAELMGGDGTVPALFFFRDLDANSLMVGNGMRKANQPVESLREKKQRSDAHSATAWFARGAPVSSLTVPATQVTA
jgi:hypothetical protein